MKLIKIIKFFVALNLFNVSLAMESVEELSNFVKAPLTRLAINNMVWTVSIANLTTWWSHKPDEKSSNAHSIVIFEGMGEQNISKESVLERIRKDDWQQANTDDYLKVMNGLPKEPEFKLDENGIWILGIDLRIAGSLDETTDNFLGSYLLAPKKGEVNFFNSQSTKSKLERPYIVQRSQEGNVKFGHYEIFNSFQILSLDAINAINQVYLNQENIIYSRALGSISQCLKNPILTSYLPLNTPYINPYLSEDKYTYDLINDQNHRSSMINHFNCVSFAEAVMRCCGIFDIGGLTSKDRNLLGTPNFLSPCFLPSTLGLTFHARFYEPSNKDLWEDILQNLKINQLTLDPSVSGLDSKEITLDKANEITNECVIF